VPTEMPSHREYEIVARRGVENTRPVLDQVSQRKHLRVAWRGVSTPRDNPAGHCQPKVDSAEKPWWKARFPGRDEREITWPTKAKTRKKHEFVSFTGKLRPDKQGIPLRKTRSIRLRQAAALRTALRATILKYPTIIATDANDSKNRKRPLQPVSLGFSKGGYSDGGQNAPTVPNKENVFDYISFILRPGRPRRSTSPKDQRSAPITVRITCRYPPRSRFPSTADRFCPMRTLKSGSIQSMHLTSNGLGRRRQDDELLHPFPQGRGLG
jgi:hypothetical protein